MTIAMAASVIVFVASAVLFAGITTGPAAVAVPPVPIPIAMSFIATPVFMIIRACITTAIVTAASYYYLVVPVAVRSIDTAVFIKMPPGVSSIQYYFVTRV